MNPTLQIFIHVEYLSGEFPIVNKHLLKDLVKLDLWNENMKNKIIAANGSVQDIPEIPQDLKEIYKTVWEIKQRSFIDMAADRGAYICQSQSLNIFIQDTNFAKLTSMHFYAWKKGLKTGMYYLRSKSAADAVKFTVDQSFIKQAQENGVLAAGSGIKKEEAYEQMACSLDDPESCEACGS